MSLEPTLTLGDDDPFLQARAEIASVITDILFGMADAADLPKVDQQELEMQLGEVADTILAELGLQVTSVAADGVIHATIDTRLPSSV